jgi:hypothetical protein
MRIKYSLPLGVLVCVASAWTSLAAAQDVPERGPPPILDKEPVVEIPPDAAPSLFTPLLDAAVAEGGNAWIPRSKAWGHGAVIRVCFLNGSPELNRYVAQHASAWNDVGADVRLDFGPSNNPRVCAPNSVEPIRVAYNNASVNWSRYGKDSIIGQADPYYGPRTAYWNEPSMQLDVNNIQDYYYGRGVIIHEFGHALGLYHEHQKPVSDGCEVEFNWPRVYADMWRNQRWDQAKVDSQLRPVYDFYDEEVMTSGIDLTSVMMYAMPASNFRRGSDSHCYLAEPVNEISAGDAAVVRYVYGEDAWGAHYAGLGEAARTAYANGQPAVARALILYRLPLTDLTDVAETYSSDLAFGFNPEDNDASAQLSGLIDAELNEIIQ